MVDTNAALIGPDAILRKYPPKQGRTLVVGSKCYGSKQDRRALYGDAIGIDLFAGDGVDLVHDLERPLDARHGQFDHVDCVSVMEHCARPWRMAENIERAMVAGGTIYVRVPFSWRVHAYPSDYWRMTPAALPVLFPSIIWRFRKFWTAGTFRKLVPGRVDDDVTMMQRAETVGFGQKCA